MGKEFNVTGACDPARHYMADITRQLEEIKKLVDAGAYFTVNRARQYGKTTTLRALCRYLLEDYYTVFIDFQSQMSEAKFRDEIIFSNAFAKAFILKLRHSKHFLSETMNDALVKFEKTISEKKEELDLVELFHHLSEVCEIADKPIVLIIDEVDQASNNQVFLDFLSQLRGGYLDRTDTATFQSVILSGVYDVKYMKMKIRPSEEKRSNSPWNIAADFDVVMSLSRDSIAGMLKEYENDHKTGMDITGMAGEIYEYTSGYPFLVSRLCLILDRQSFTWDKNGLLEAVKTLLAEKNTLFESLVNKLNEYPEIRHIVYEILFHGSDITYNSLNKAIEIAEIFGFVCNDSGRAAISNRIFETIFYNYFLSEELIGSPIYKSGTENKNQFIHDGHLDMKRILEKFVEAFDAIYGDKSDKFIEETGRKYFLLFLKPIINGVGNCYIESRTRNLRRTDVIVDYLGEQFIIELKIWRGDKYNSDGEQQIAEYIDFYHLKKGYMLTFNFNRKKEIGVREVQHGDVTIVEAFV